MSGTDFHARLLTEAQRWGNGDGRFNLCVDCGATGCPLCNGTGWRDSHGRHLRVLPTRAAIDSVTGKDE